MYKYLAVLGGVFLMLSFGIVFFSIFYVDIDKEITVQNKTLGYTQVQETRDFAIKKLAENTALNEFGELLGTHIDQMKEKITTFVHATFSDV